MVIFGVFYSAPLEGEPPLLGFTFIYFFLVLIASSNWTFAFIVTRFYQPVSDAVGNYTTFWGFAILLVITITLIVIFVPETKGRSLEEIQQFFRSNTDVDESPIIDDQVTLEDENRSDVDPIVP